MTLQQAIGRTPPPVGFNQNFLRLRTSFLEPVTLLWEATWSKMSTADIPRYLQV